MLQRIFKAPNGPVSFWDKIRNIAVAYTVSILWLFFVFGLLTRGKVQ